MQLAALIIDDEPLAHKVILEYARDIPFLTIKGQCYLATEALEILNQTTIDLLFLDIRMPRIQGLDFLRSLDKRPTVIITSAYEEYALESFELEVCDYLHKPFRFERFLKAVNRALERHQSKPKSPTTPLFIKSDKRLIQVDPDDIYYLESYGNYVKIWLEDHFHLTLATLSSFEDQLPSTDFFRIHKSFFLNRKYIDYVEGNQVCLKNGKQLPISKRYGPAFRRGIQ